ncbi:MAG: hypothetical protein ABSG62_21730 [Terracidiphilus sp.]|jgi:hypothetical protein
MCRRRWWRCANICNGLAEKPDNLEWDAQLDQTSKTLQAAHLAQYRKTSQTNTHVAVSGVAASVDHSRPAIELFQRGSGSFANLPKNE